MKVLRKIWGSVAVLVVVVMAMLVVFAANPEPASAFEWVEEVSASSTGISPPSAILDDGTSMITPGMSAVVASTNDGLAPAALASVTSTGVRLLVIALVGLSAVLHQANVTRLRGMLQRLSGGGSSWMKAFASSTSRGNPRRSRAGMKPGFVGS